MSKSRAPETSEQSDPPSFCRMSSSARRAINSLETAIPKARIYNSGKKMAFDRMDAEAIYSAYCAKTLAKDGRLQHGPLLTDINVLKIVPQGLTFRGGYVPDLNTRVVVHVGGMSVEGIISSRGDLRGAILFVRPVPPSAH